MGKRRNKFAILFSILTLSTIILYSCYPDYGLAPSDFDTVLTLYDKSENFNKPTYAMPDTVVHLVEAGVREEDIDRSYDALILSTIADNMTRLGYMRVPIDTTQAAPSYVILASVTKTDRYSTVIQPPSWGWWPGWGWWGPWRGWWYPGRIITYKYKTGTVFIDMINPLKINSSDDSFGAVWFARLNSLLDGSITGSRIVQRIDDAFNQSPYLGAN